MVVSSPSTCMEDKSLNFHTHTDISDTHIEAFTKWLSCNGEVWGVGPTTVFASAAALFLYHELEATIFDVGDHVQVSTLEKGMVSTMVLGMLALMIHIWVCAMRFFQYYLDTLIKDSPNVLLEMTTAGLLGGPETAVLGPLTRFLRQQQPQIHITLCWFLSLCYADYVRKHYCQRFNMPYLEQWQAEVHERTARQARVVMEKAHSFVSAVHWRLRGFTRQQNNTECVSAKTSAEDIRPHIQKDGCGGVYQGPLSKVDASLSTDRDSSAATVDARLRVLSCESTADAIEKLKDIIQSTRCVCPSSQNTGHNSTGPVSIKDPPPPSTEH